MKNELELLKNKIIDTAAMKLDFPLTDNDIDKIAEELANIEDKHWYWCTFRKSYLLCLYGNEDVNNKSEMSWLPIAKNCHTLINLCEEFIFPMTNIKPRIIVIRTFPNTEMREHTDCYKDQLENLEPKLRLVVKGRKNNTLYFVNDKAEQVHISDEWRSYIMSGASLHGMKNIGGEKYTVCWGDPWVGDNLENQNFVEYIKSQFDKHGNTAISRSSLGKVDHAAGIKNPKIEKIYSWKDWNENKKD